MRNDKWCEVTQNSAMRTPRGRNLSPSVLGIRLRARREAMGLTQEQLGVAVGIDESCGKTRISRYESGVHEPPLHITKQLANALGVSLPYLFCCDETTAEVVLIADRLDSHEKELLLEFAKKILFTLAEGHVKQCTLGKQFNGVVLDLL